MNTERTRIRRPASPFDDSVIERHRRMGLLTESNEVQTGVVEIVGQIHAGLFFDQLCDAYENYSEVVAICRQFIKRAAKADAKQTLLMISVEYDAMRRPLPELIWWISGSAILLPLFISSFITNLTALLQEETYDTEDQSL